MRSICLTCLVIAMTFALLACAAREEPAPESGADTQQPESVQPAPNDIEDQPTEAAPVETEVELWRDQLIEVAGEFRRGYTRLSDDPFWAPTMCRAPMPSGPLLSRATTKKLHGQKLYYLWVKDSTAYEYTADFEDAGTLTLKTQPVGQALIKESYHPKEPGSRVAGEAAPLFVMLKLDPSTEGTDNGWVYGTLTPDGKTVTSAGRIEACMDCHGIQEDRLFGPPVSDFRVPRTPPQDE